MVVADTTQGPVVIDATPSSPHSHAWKGRATSARARRSSARRSAPARRSGPQCRIGGEVEASIVQGHSNKYHDGFLGHAYVGEWVNLGAGTQNSDLRNDYGEVTVMVNGRPVRDRADQGRLLPRRPHQDRPRYPAQHRHERRRVLQPLARPAVIAEVRAVVHERSGTAPREAFTVESCWRPPNRRWAAVVLELTDAHRTLYAHVYEETLRDRQRGAGQRRAASAAAGDERDYQSGPLSPRAVRRSRMVGLHTCRGDRLRIVRRIIARSACGPRAASALGESGPHCVPPTASESGRIRSSSLESGRVPRCSGPR